MATLKQEHRTFTVKATMVVSGDIPRVVIEDHIRTNLEEELDGLEIEIHGEAYNADEVWAVFTSEVKLEVNEIGVEFKNNPFCEGCGERHADFAAEIYVGGTGWCINCAEANGDITKSFAREIKKKEGKLLREYYNSMLASLGEETDDPEGEDITCGDE